MTVLESLWVALFCMLGVFAVLICLYLILKLFSVALGAVLTPTRKPTKSVDAKSAAPAQEDDFSSGTLRLKDVDEPTAAMIMAIVSDESGIPLSELCFKSIKLLLQD